MVKNKEKELDVLWYFPSNRWIYRHNKSKIVGNIIIPIENKEKKIKKRITIVPGENVLSQEEYDHILEHSSKNTLSCYFSEGSFVWGKDKKTNSFTDTQSDKKASDIDELLVKVSQAATIEDLEKIISESKDEAVMLAVRERLNEINKANSVN
jgi:hypothetical protein